MAPAAAPKGRRHRRLPPPGASLRAGGAAGPLGPAAPTAAGAPSVNAATTAGSTRLVQKPIRPRAAGRGCGRGPPRPGNSRPPGAYGSSAPRPRRHRRVGYAGSPGEPSAPRPPAPWPPEQTTRPGQPSQPQGQKVVVTNWVKGPCGPGVPGAGARRRERPGGWESSPKPALTNAQPRLDFQRPARGDIVVRAARTCCCRWAMACNSAA